MLEEVHGASYTYFIRAGCDHHFLSKPTSEPAIVFFFGADSESKLKNVDFEKMPTRTYDLIFLMPKR